MRKIFAILLVAATLLSLTACGNKNVEKTDEGTAYYLGSDIDKSVFNSPENTLDAEKIYNTIEYTEEMFYGIYWLNNFDSDIKEFSESTEFTELEYWYPYGDGEIKTELVSKLPVKIEAGVPNLYSHRIRVDRNYHWAYLTFARENATYVEVLCSFSIEGNKIRFTPVDYYEEITDDNHKFKEVKYKTGEDSLEYSFSLKGPNFTLSQGDLSVTLRSFYFSENTSNMSISGYKAQNSATLGNIDTILGSDIAVYLNDTNGKLMFHSTMKPAIKYSENGVLTLFWAETDSDGNDIKHVRQFVCFGAGYSMTLVDNDNIYYYTESYTSRELAALTDGLSSEETAQVGELSESELKEIAEKKSSLLDDLANEFSSQGINVAINRSTGELAMDASVLFGGDSAVITNDGKEFLNKFLAAYTSIIYNEKYDGFIEKTMIEGHTAPVAGSTYESGLPLSEERAENVKNYCLSADTGVDTSKLSAKLESVGLSNSKPVYNSNGEVDMAASRRVSFRFMINIDQQ